MSASIREFVNPSEIPICLILIEFLYACVIEARLNNTKKILKYNCGICISIPPVAGISSVNLIVSRYMWFVSMYFNIFLSSSK